MTSKTKQMKKHKTSLLERIPAWFVIVCGLAAMLLFAFAAPMVALRLQDSAQLSVTTQGTRESVNVDFMDVEQLEIREKLRRVALAEESGEQLYTITTSASFTRNEKLAFLQNVRERNNSMIDLLEMLLKKTLLDPYETGLGNMVQYVVLDENANYLFSFYYLSSQDYEGNQVEMLADRDDYSIYWIQMDMEFETEEWAKGLYAYGYTPRTWADEIVEGTAGTYPLYSRVEDTYQTTNYMSTGYESLDFGGFHYESVENVGQEGELCRLYFSEGLEFYDSYEEVHGALIYSSYCNLYYGFSSVVEMAETAYGELELENYDTDANTNANLQEME